MSSRGEYPTASFSSAPRFKGVSWYSGQPLSIKIPTPLAYTIDSDRPGNLKAMHEGYDCPLMRNDLIEALQAAGVNNLELFDAVIVDEASKVEHRDHKAFNVVGIVSATDFGSSVVASADSNLIDVFFESLSIDETKASGFRLFRLAESVTTIIVDERVKNEIEKRAVPGMIFLEPEDWAG
jgi:hypothetical protein